MILLDTNVVVAYLNGKETIVSKVIDNLDKIALSTILVAELDYGAKASNNCVKSFRSLNCFIQLVRIIPFDILCAKMLWNNKEPTQKNR